MKKTIYVNVAFSLFFLLLSPLFTACDMTGSDPGRGYDGKAAVRVHIGADGIQGRTVRPAVALQDVSAWELRGGMQGDEEALLVEFSNAEDAMVALDVGTWSFTLMGYKDDALILTGSIVEQAISLTETNVLAFTVAPVLEGEGTVNIVVELPAGSGITAARVFQDGTELESPLAPIDDRLVFAETYDAGAYYFSIWLYKNDDLYGVVSEAVYVWANLQSEKTYTLTRENLNLTYVITYHLWEEETEFGYYQYTDASLTLAKPYRQDYVFRGWYEEADFSGGAVAVIPTGSTGDKDFYAKWITAAQSPSDYSFAESLAWIRNRAEEGDAYTITLNANETINPTELYFEDKKMDIILKGGEAERTLALTSNGSLFTVNSGVTLTLGNNVALQGRSDNDAPLVRVNAGGALVMDAGARISGNASSSGGGVQVNSGTFAMNGGEISGNTASSNGGGVYVNSGTLAMSGGSISGNAAENGGGVYVDSGTFAMNGGTIVGNTAGASGGGVFVNNNSAFTMSGGEIGGNTASSGGGVYASGTFAKRGGGVIYGSNADSALKNTAQNDDCGHAVYVASGSKIRNGTAGESVALDGLASGSAGGWETPIPNDLSLVQSLAWLSSYAEEGGSYTIVLNDGETIGPQMLSYKGKNLNIVLKGGEAERTLALNSNGAFFTVDSGVALTLGNNVALQGRSDNTTPLARVNGGGTLTMESGSKIRGNTTASNGGAVVVNNNGAFIMNGGEISGNTSSSNGGAVYMSGGTFTMTGGTIADNAAENGGGVYVGGGTFVKQSGGIIYGIYDSYGANADAALKNTAAAGDACGHAVYVASGNKIRNSTAGEDAALDSGTSGAAGGWSDPMPATSLQAALAWLDANAEEGGSYAIVLNADETIEPKTLFYDGKNVSVTLEGGETERTVSLSSNGSLFTVDGGVALTLGNNVALQGRSDNTSSLVNVDAGGTLLMNAGSKISGNASSSNGGAVVVNNNGAFTMSGGEISGNAAENGGGVYVDNGGTFVKQSGGIIYGSDAGDSALKNIAASGDADGHAVYVASSPVKVRNATAGEGVDLDSGTSGAAGGWE